MFTKILIALVLIVAVFCVVAALQPAGFQIARSATIPAPPAVVFAQINDLHKFNEWSPWAKLDPNSKVTFDGPPAGVGSSMAWAGNSQVGEGKMTVVESKPGQLVQMKLEFLKPFTATNTADFTLDPEGDQTKLTWSMSGTNNFMAKAFGLIVNCDKMVGGQFEQGLENLKANVAKPTKS